MRGVLRLVLGLGVVATVGAAAAFLLYAQTEDGFRRVVLPLAASLFGGDLTAERGKVSLTGAIEIEEGRYRNETAGVDIALARLEARIAPRSLLRGERLRIELLDVVGLQLTIATAPAGDPLSARPEPVEGRAHPSTELRVSGEGAKDDGGFAVPLHISEARLRGAKVVLRRGTETTMEIGPLDVELRDVRPGRNATLVLDGAATLAPGTSEAESLTLELNAELALDAAGSPKQGRLEADLGLDPTKPKPSEPVHLRLVLEASASEKQSVDFILRAHGAQAGTHTGRFTVTGNWPLDSDPLETPPSLKAAMEIEDLSRYDSILTMLGWNLFESGTIRGDIEIAPAAGNASAVKVRLEGERLSAWLPTAGGSTPPLALSLVQQGSWSPAKKQLRVDAAALRLRSEGGGTIDSVLDGKILLDLASRGRAAAAREEPAVWTTELARIDFAHLDAWLATIGNHALGGMSGTLDGKLRVDVAELGGRIAATGRLGLEHFRLNELAVPLGVATDLDLTVRDLERIAISGIELKLAAGRRPLFAATVTGDYDLRRDAGRLDIGLESEDLAAALSGLAVLPSDSSHRMHGGRTSGTFQASLGNTIEVTGAASIEGIQLALENGARERRDVRIEAEVKRSEGVVDFRKLVVSVLDPATTTPATLTLSGALPDASRTSFEGTELKLDIRGLALGHWIEAFGGPAVELIGSVPLEGDLTLRRAAGESRLTLAGEERVVLRSGPVPTGETIEVTARNMVEWLPGEATKFSVDLSTRGADHVTVAGVLEPEGDLDLDVDIGQLRFREVELSSGRVRLDRVAGRTRLVIAPTRAVGGRIEGSVEHDVNGGRDLSWSFRTHKVDVGRLYRSFVGDGRRVEGILDLETTGQGKGRDADQLQRNVTGAVEARMAEARFAGTPLFSYLSKVTGIAQFEDVVFNSVVADIAIGNGMARIRHMEGSGHAANIQVTGQATLTGDLDLKVNPRVGPSLAGSVEKIFAVGMLVRTATDFVALPIDVTVKGPYDDPKYAVEPRVPGALDRLTAGVAGGAAGAVVDTGKAVGGGAIKGVGGILKKGGSLFGGRSRKGSK